MYTVYYGILENVCILYTRIEWRMCVYCLLGYTGECVYTVYYGILENECICIGMETRAGKPEYIPYKISIYEYCQ